MVEEALSGYCMKCRQKQPIQDPQPVYTATGTPGTRGTCPTCGTTIFRMGAIPAHEGVPKPDIGKAGSGSKKKTGCKQSRSGQAAGGNKRLVIVESPAKARTIGRFLGRDYVVKASVGHVRDLLRSQLSVDVEHDFAPKYRVPKEKREVVNELKAAVKLL